MLASCETPESFAEFPDPHNVLALLNKVPFAKETRAEELRIRNDRRLVNFDLSSRRFKIDFCKAKDGPSTDKFESLESFDSFEHLASFCEARPHRSAAPARSKSQHNVGLRRIEPNTQYSEHKTQRTS